MDDFSDEEGGGVIEGNTQPITLIQLQTTLHELVDFYTKEIIKNFSESLTRDSGKATVLQNPDDTLCMKKDLKAGSESLTKMAADCLIPEFIVSTDWLIEYGKKEQDQKQNLKDYNLKETFPDLFIQKKSKILRRAGVNIIKSKIGNGTFQHLYKNGLINSLMENCGRLKGQYTDDLQPQQQNQTSAEANTPEGLRFKWRTRKKFKEKD